MSYSQVARYQHPTGLPILVGEPIVLEPSIVSFIVLVDGTLRFINIQNNTGIPWNVNIDTSGGVNLECDGSKYYANFSL